MRILLKIFFWILEFEIDNLAFDLSWGKSKKNPSLEFYVPINPQYMCRTRLTQHFHLMTLFDLTLAFAFA